MALARALIQNEESIVVLAALLIQVLFQVVAVLAVQRVGLVQGFLEMAGLVLGLDPFLGIEHMLDDPAVLQRSRLGVHLLLRVHRDLVVLGDLPRDIGRHGRLWAEWRLLLNDGGRRRDGLLRFDVLVVLALVRMGVLGDYVFVGRFHLGRDIRVNILFIPTAFLDHIQHLPLRLLLLERELSLRRIAQRHVLLQRSPQLILNLQLLDQLGVVVGAACFGANIEHLLALDLRLVLFAERAVDRADHLFGAVVLRFH